MPVSKKKIMGIPTIDVCLVVIRTGTESDGVQYAIDTASSVQVETQTEETDAIRLMKLGKLLAQKPSKSTITGHQITLTDNVFTPEIVLILQGGSLVESEAPVEGHSKVTKYVPPKAGSDEKGMVFELDCYSAEYDASGQIVQYEKITYPNCQGTPVAINSEDDTFRVPEYVINSAPKTGEAPYTIEYVKELPISEFDDAYAAVSLHSGAPTMSVPTAVNDTAVAKKSSK